MEILIYIIPMLICLGSSWWLYDQDNTAGIVIFGCGFIPALNLFLATFCILFVWVMLLAYPLIWLKERRWEK